MLGAPGGAATTEVVVTLKAPSLAAFGRSLQSGALADHSLYRARMEAAQNTLVRRIQSVIPGASVRWRYRVVANGFAIVVPRARVAALAQLPGVEAVWPNVRYHALRDTGGPER